MPKSVTSKLDEETYTLFSRLAVQDNRPLPNFMETAARKFIEEQESTDEFEMAEIKSNERLNSNLRQAHDEVARKQGQFIE